MNLSDKLLSVQTIFIDTAPIIYYIEAHPKYGPLVKKVVDFFQSNQMMAFTSVITLTEVLSKPIEKGDKKLTREFSKFLKQGKNITLTDISSNIAEQAGNLRGKYLDLRTIDAIQISAAVDIDADVFLTNDKRLKKIKEIEIIILNDYL